MGEGSDQRPETNRSRPQRPWVTRADVIAALALAVIFVVWVAVIVIRQHRTGQDIKIIRSPESAARYRVDLNEADKPELMLLPGIGAKRAERIVQWRREHGRFKTFEDVRKAADIPPKVMIDLRDLVMLGHQEKEPTVHKDTASSSGK